MDIFDRLRVDFEQSSTWQELAVLVICIGLAWLLTRSFYHHRDVGKPSVWFGKTAWGGALFPLLALLFTAAARMLVEHYQPVFLLRLAVQILLSLAVIRMVARVLAKTFPNSTLVRLIERIFSWLAWGVAVLGILGVLPQVMAQLDSVQFAFGKTSISVLELFQGAISVGMVMLVVLWISTTFEQRVIDDMVKDLSMRKMAVNLTRMLLITIGLLVALSLVGVDLTALSVLGGAFGVGLGFGMQKIASNYVSGFLVLIERALRIGDNVRVDGFEGRITDIRTRYTVIRASNGRESIVPNETLITQRVENLTDADQKFNLATQIVVGADSDVAQVREVLKNAALAQDRVLAKPEPSVFLVNFAPDGLEFSLSFYINDPMNGQANVKSAVNIAVLEGLRAAKIDIPFPQRVLHIPNNGGGAIPASQG
ncbi:mechanosensitive ion channel [Comamonas piscis]|uniref:Mechanosensitive ion channel n=1 Tax=Comamonas piscis TaxID=1562974 RepID=A0A7G5EG81_9BURK|nr:mechanosensitive ion channel domain-containing protein [Comamonas piscis]QMV73006.1 mechanosensitive ion channel [Comamonas piscis]WSO35791.1 mechanosensitive ion channel domain-containing protein [Comamonas piscis]